MEVLQNLKIPTVMDEIVAVYKEYKRSFYSGLSLMHYDGFKNATDSLFAQVKAMKYTNDQKNAVRILIGVKVLGRLRSSYQNELRKKISDVLPVTDTAGSEFASYVISKFCKKKYTKDQAFLQMIISRAAEFLAFKTPTANRSKTIRQGALILLYLSRNSASAVSSVTQQFVDAVTIGLYHKDSEIREMSANAMTEFLTNTNKVAFIKGAFKKAKTLVKSQRSEDVHSALLMYRIVATFNPSLLKGTHASVIQWASKFIKNREKYVSVNAMKLIVAAAPLDPVAYRTAFADSINGILFHSKTSSALVQAALPIFDTFADTLESHADAIIETTESLFLGKSERIGFALLMRFAEAMPACFEERINKIAGLIHIAPLSSDFLVIIPVLKKFDMLWKLVQHSLSSRFTISQPCLAIISQCPDFEEPYMSELFHSLYPKLSQIEAPLKAYLPGVLTKVRPYHDPVFVDSLLNIAITDVSSEVRLAVVNSFGPCQYKDLVFPKALKMLHVLCNDEVIEIRKAAIMLLRSLIEIDPCNVLPLFRQLIISSLFVITSDHSIKTQMEVSEVLPTLLPCSEMMMHIYVPVFVHTVMSYLKGKTLPSNERSVHQTFFEKEWDMVIARNYVKTIDLVFEIQPQLLDEMCLEIMELFVSLLDTTTNKGLVFAILNAFQSILDYKGLAILDSFPNFLVILLSLGSKMSSRKILSALFKIFGRVGSSMNINSIDMNSTDGVDNTDLSQLGSTVLYQDWYLSVVASALLSFLLDEEGASTLKFYAMQVIVVSLNSSSECIRPYFDKFVEYIFSAIRTVPVDETDHYFSTLQSIISQHSDWLKPFSSNFADLILGFSRTNLFMKSLDLIPPFIRSAKESFSPYIQDLVSTLLDVLYDTLADKPDVAQKILFTLATLTPFPTEYALVIVRKICDCVMSPVIHSSVIVAALNTLQIMIVKHDCVAVSSQVFRVCKYFLTVNDETVKKTVAVLSSTLESRVEMFRSPSIAMRESSKKFDDSHSMMSFDDELDFRHGMFSLNLNENILIESSHCGENMVSGQWKDWAINFILCVIGQSPSQVIKSCHGIAQQSETFALKIFHPAFLSCWTQMSEYSKTTVCNSFITAMNDKETPLSVLATLIGLAEFMERIEQHIHVPYVQLARVSERVGKRAFAFYCADRALSRAAPHKLQMIVSPLLAAKPRRFSSPKPMTHASGKDGDENDEEDSKLITSGSRSYQIGPSSSPYDLPLHISYSGEIPSEYSSEVLHIEPEATNEIPLPSSPFSRSVEMTNPEGIEAAEVGLLVMSELSMDADMQGLITSAHLKMNPVLAEQLRDWQTAVQLYKNYVNDNDCLIRLLSAYQKLHNWEEIISTFDRFDDLPVTVKSHSAIIYADAFFHVGNWTMFDYTISTAPADSLEKIILHATADVMRGKDIASITEKGFTALAMRAGPLFVHGYASITPFFTEAQQLVELSEFSRKSTLKWNERKMSSFSVYKSIYETRIFLTKDIEEVKRYLKMCRKSEDWGTHEVYCQMFPDDPHIKYEKVLSLWKQKRVDEAFKLLDEVVESLPDGIPLKSKALYKKSAFMIRSDSRTSHLNRCAEIAERSATKKAWALFGWIRSRLYNLKIGNRAEHAIKAIEGFAKDPGLPEAQQLASILFRSGKYPEVFESVSEILNDFPCKFWLQMLPQVFSHLTIPSRPISTFLKELTSRLLKEHHHGVIFSLLFISARENNDPELQEVAIDLLHKYASEYPEIVKEAKTFHSGFVNACTTTGETWMDSLAKVCEALKQNDAETMKAIIAPLLESLSSTETEDQVEFKQKYSDRIDSLQPLLETFYEERTRKAMEVLYKELSTLYSVIKTDLEPVRSLNLCDVAPGLDRMTNANISVPGTYNIGSPVITIHSVIDSIQVFNSKQRPKRISIIGSDGLEYFYLLKGREDLRLDERAMQYFSLINSLIDSHIVTYYVLPLSRTCGLIQWINNSDTISKLIKEHRINHGVSVDIESRRIASISIANYDMLRPIQRLEALYSVADSSDDSVLADIMWLKSPNPETWLRRVSTFAKTSALMSIVGYILGLGDRHPSNIMIDRETGKVIHIDLGDCFEVARNRLLFPELIPFRLTRCMVRTLGPGGVNGYFRATCIDTMKIIRRRRESVMAVLEIFVHSPIYVHGVRRDAVSEKEQVSKTITRISDKMSGNDFEGMKNLNCRNQVSMLIRSATDPYNLSYLYRGWNPLW